LACFGNQHADEKHFVVFFFGAERDTNMLGGVWRFDENTSTGSDNKDSKTDMGKVASILQPSQSRKQY
jgi:hypothetical protein